jgi:hypothetical protein
VAVLADGVPADWGTILRDEAAGYAGVALANIVREFPTVFFHYMEDADDLPDRPRVLTPVFYGSLDWHSCVEMHWLLVRLLRVAGDAVPATEIRAALDRQFAPEDLATEAMSVAGPNGDSEEPYGWAWALTLVHEVLSWDDPDARRWAAALRPLEEALTGRFGDWLAGATYPVRYGMHRNTAFALSRALPYAAARAVAGEPGLLAAITGRASEWFGGDTDYPGRYEPSAHDFLSPALAEAELMASLLPSAEFAGWLTGFLPGIAESEPASLFTPAVVSDPSNGQIAHLHGLNASRAWCWRRIAEALPAGDPRTGPALAGARVHAATALPHVVGSDYMVEHWLAAYAVLLLS